jgi:hypothetical protein
MLACSNKIIIMYFEIFRCNVYLKMHGDEWNLNGQMLDERLFWGLFVTCGTWDL